jgi:subtilisin family serine protease
MGQRWAGMVVALPTSAGNRIAPGRDPAPLRWDGTVGGLPTRDVKGIPPVMPSAPSRARRLSAGLALVLSAALGPAVPARADLPVAPPEGLVYGAGAADAIAGRYLVVLKNPAAVAATAQGLVGDKVTRMYGGLAAFSAHLSPLEARRLAANPAVSLVEQDRTVRIDTTERNPTWNLDRIDQRRRTASRTYTPTDDGSSVHAYVIDTGIRISHLDFGGRAHYGYDFVDGDRTAQDCNGHGTHVAGTIGGARFGVAKKVQLVAVRVLDCDGFGTLEGVVDGVNWVTEHAIRPAVANMSLGAGHSSILDYAVSRSIASSVTYAVAAGNDNRNARSYSPADVPAAITVGATDRRDRRASFSNYGSTVDIFAPGVAVWAAYNLADDIIARLSGTSMASPHVAGAAALVLDANPSWSPAKVRDYLVRRSTTGRVTKRGSGSPNRLLFVTAPPAAPVIRTTTVLPANLRVAYRAQLSLTAARRGSWRLLEGRLPAGLRLSTSGLLSGTPTAPGSTVVTIGFTDYVPTTTHRGLRVTVRLTPPTITTTTLPSGTANQAYSASLSSGGRVGTWSLVGGTVPAGVALSASGTLSGSPLASGSFGVGVRFTDAWHQSVVRTLPLTVVTGTDLMLADGSVGVPYTDTLAGFVPAGAWTVASGTLPDGLSLAPDGSISGTPTGTETQAVTFANVNGGVTRLATLVIDVR